MTTVRITGANSSWPRSGKATMYWLVVAFAACTVIVRSGSACSKGLFACKSGQCIPSSWRCDGTIECDDHSDELDCPCHGKPSQFRCNSGDKCIPTLQRCDNKKDCPDNSDEMNCSCNAVTHFSCHSGSQCISRDLECDGISDCHDRSDETSRPCGTPKPRRRVCVGNEFQCDREPRYCIPSSWFCDGTADCPGGSDEPKEGKNACPNSTKKTCEELDPSLRSCKKSSQCIESLWICDDHQDCHFPDDDEGEHCGGTTRPNPTLGPTTTPPANVALDCASGNLANCKGASLFVLFSSLDSLRLAQLGKDVNVEIIASNLSRIEAMAYDSVSSRAFFVSYQASGEAARFQHVLVDRQQGQAVPKPFVTNNVGNPKSIALDWNSRLVYWTSLEGFHNSSIQVSTISGSYRQVLVRLDNTRVWGIAVDPQNKYLFWTEFYPKGRIVRTNLMGSEVKDISQKGNEVFSPTAIALDRTKRTVYFSDKSRRYLESISYDGENQRFLFETRRVTGLGFFENFVYWVSNFEDLRAIQTNVTKSEDTLVSFSDEIKISDGYDLALVHRDLQPKVENPCSVNNGGCEALCFAINDQAVCSCDGVAEKHYLAADQKTCSKVPTVSTVHQVEFVERSTLQISCTITKTPNFDIDKLEWKQGDHVVEGSTTNWSVPYQPVATLTVRNIGTEASGTYHCVVSGTFKNPITGTSEPVQSEVNSKTAVHIDIQPSQKSDSSSKTTTIIAVVVPLLVIVVIIFLLVACWKQRGSGKHSDKDSYENPIVRSTTHDVYITAGPGADGQLPMGGQHSV